MDDKLQAQKMVWMMLLATIATYMALPAMIEPLSSEGPAPVLPMAFAAMALSMAGAIFAIPSLMSRLPVADEEQAAHRPFQAKILQWVLAESIAVFGLVLYLLGGGTTWLWAFGALAAVLMGLHAPREERVADSRDLIRPDVKIG